jgi:hypothetical protein
MTMLRIMVVVLACMAGAIQGQQIRGRVVDPTGAGIPAEVKILESGTGAIVHTATAAQSGGFRSGALPAGSYTVRLWNPGFRRRDLARFVVEEGRTIDLGDIRLDLAGCDAPGTSCDWITTDAVPEPVPAWLKNVVAQGYLNMKLGSTSPEVHLQFQKEGTILLLVATNSAALSLPNAADAVCGDAKYTENRIRVEGLGRGVDFCVRANQGAMSHVFFTDDVQADATEIRLWHVTRKFD